MVTYTSHENQLWSSFCVCTSGGIKKKSNGSGDILFFCFLVLEAACNTSTLFVPPAQWASVKQENTNQMSRKTYLHKQYLQGIWNKLIEQIAEKKTEQRTMLFNALVIQSSAGEDVVYDSTNQVFHCGGQTIVVTHGVLQMDAMPTMPLRWALSRLISEESDKDKWPCRAKGDAARSTGR